MTPRLRADLDAVPSYVPGRSVLGAVKLASNEMPFPPLPAVLDAIAAASSSLPRYPDTAATALAERLAAKHGVDRSQITLGCGSVELCQQLIQITCTAADAVVYPWRSFEAYPIQTRIVGARPVPVPLVDEALDLDAIAGAVTDSTRIVFICSPNNPTGTAVPAAAVDQLLDTVPDDVLVVLDEAYREFVDDPAVGDGLDQLARRANVVVLRTMSKAYGLAGLRVGYAVGPRATISAMRKVALPFGVNVLAQAAALAALDCEDEVAARCTAVRSERSIVWRGLVEQGYRPPPAQGNFVWLPLRDRSAAFAAHCERSGVLVRPFQDADTGGVRITIGLPQHNRQLLGASAGFVNS